MVAVVVAVLVAVVALVVVVVVVVDLFHWGNAPKRGGSAEANLYQLGAVRGERQKDG